MKKLYILTLLAFSLNVANAQTSLTQAVDFTVTDIHGNTFNLFNHLDSGKHVIIDFFFTTCGPCQASVPTLNDAYTKYGCNTGDVFFISIDDRNDDATVSQYETDFSSLLPAASGSEGGGSAVASSYGVSAFPTVILIAPDRAILEQDIYPVSGLDAALSSAGLQETSCSNSNVGIGDIVNDGQVEDHRVFDILGREWKMPYKELPRGLYIINGKKVFKTNINN